MKVDNITLMMFVLNFVEFCFILELIYSSDFHEGRQYFMLMLVLNFAKKQFLNLTINIQLLYFITTKFIQPGTISVRGTVLYRASSAFFCCWLLHIGFAGGYLE